MELSSSLFQSRGHEEGYNTLEPQAGPMKFSSFSSQWPGRCFPGTLVSIGWRRQMNHQKTRMRGWHNGSEGQGACCQAWWSKFNPWDPHDGRRKLIPTNSLWHPYRSHLVKPPNWNFWSHINFWASSFEAFWISDFWIRDPCSVMSIWTFKIQKARQSRTFLVSRILDIKCTAWALKLSIHMDHLSIHVKHVNVKHGKNKTILELLQVAMAILIILSTCEVQWLKKRLNKS